MQSDTLRFHRGCGDRDKCSGCSQSRRWKNELHYPRNGWYTMLRIGVEFELCDYLGPYSKLWRQWYHFYMYGPDHQRYVWMCTRKGNRACEGSWLWASWCMFATMKSLWAF